MSARADDRPLPHVVVLNGISSSGTSSLARAVQQLLPEPYLVLGVDDLIDALPPAMLAQEDGLVLGEGGQVDAGEAFTAVEDAWYAGLGAMARAGARLVLDEVLLGGARSQQRLGSALHGLRVVWVAVDCHLEVAADRESRRPDRTPGMAAVQVDLVHDGVQYDVRLDTSATSAAACARQLLDALRASA